MPLVDRILRILPPLALVTFAARALVPLGYMPDVSGAFGSITLCHGDPAFAIVAAYDRAIAKVHAHSDAHDSHGQLHGSADSHGHSSHSDSPDDVMRAGSHDAWEHCQFGSTLAGAALAVEYRFEPLSIDSSTPIPKTTVAVATLSLRPYSARAPPSV